MKENKAKITQWTLEKKSAMTTDTCFSSAAIAIVSPLQ